MVYVVNESEMNQIQQYFATNLSTPLKKWTFLAAQDMLKYINHDNPHKFIIVGPGENGAIGLVLAQLLSQQNDQENITIYIPYLQNDFLALQNDLNKNCFKNIERISTITITYLDDDLQNLLHNVYQIIDCWYGLNDEVITTPAQEEIFTFLNESLINILACDIPSGLNNEQVSVRPATLRACKTVTFLTYKQAFLSYSIVPYVGKITVSHLGFDPHLIEEICQKIVKNNLLVLDHITLNKRHLISNKGTYGKLLVYASSLNYINAGIMTCNMAIQSGAGHVTWILPKEIIDKIENITPEVVLCESTDRIRIQDLLTNNSNAIAFGVGQSKTERTYNTLKYISENYTRHIIVDADGLNVLDTELIRKFRHRMIITPHLAEFARLVDKTVEEVSVDRINIAQNYAQKYKIVVVLKGYQTIITDGTTVYINSTGNPYMASAGMGDTLTGLIGSFLAQGYDFFSAAYKSVYLHGLTADLIAQAKKPVLATDMINRIGYVIAEVLKQQDE